MTLTVIASQAFAALPKGAELIEKMGAELTTDKNAELDVKTNPALDTFDM